MSGYTNREMVDMHFAYHVVDMNANVIQNYYWDRYSMTRIEGRQTFECLHRRVCKTGSFTSAKKDARRERRVSATYSGHSK